MSVRDVRRVQRPSRALHAPATSMAEEGDAIGLPPDVWHASRVGLKLSERVRRNIGTRAARVELPVTHRGAADTECSPPGGHRSTPRQLRNHGDLRPKILTVPPGWLMEMLSASTAARTCRWLSKAAGRSRAGTHRADLRNEELR